MKCKKKNLLAKLKLVLNCSNIYSPALIKDATYTVYTFTHTQPHVAWQIIRGMVSWSSVKSRRNATAQILWQFKKRFYW